MDLDLSDIPRDVLEDMIKGVMKDQDGANDYLTAYLDHYRKVHNG